MFAASASRACATKDFPEPHVPFRPTIRPGAWGDKARASLSKRSTAAFWDESKIGVRDRRFVAEGTFAAADLAVTGQSDLRRHQRELSLLMAL